MAELSMWYKTSILAAGRQRQEDLGGSSGIHSEFKHWLNTYPVSKQNKTKRKETLVEGRQNSTVQEFCFLFVSLWPPG